MLVNFDQAKMKPNLVKTLAALIVSAIVPVVLLYLAGFVYLLETEGPSIPYISHTNFYGDLLIFSLLCLIYASPISFAHALFLGVPAVALAWRFRAIRWWSALAISFMIGAVPAAFVAVLRDRLLYSEYHFRAANATTLFIVPILLGVFGTGGGLAFWFVWRYWACPQSPWGRTSKSPNSDGKSTSALSEKSA
jgi:hypothetical protein